MWHYLNDNLEQCTCSQEQAVESSETCFSDISRSVQSKSKNTRETSFSQDSGTESCRNSLYGMTLRRLTGTNGEAELMWFQGDFPARTYLPPEKVEELQANEADYGPKWPESLAKYNPHTYSWRTRQCLLAGGLELFSETWPRWGMMQSGECWELTMPAHLINETVSGFWPTPRKFMHKDAQYDRGKCNLGEVINQLHGGTKTRQNYPTPTTQETEHPDAELTETGRRKSKDGENSHPLNVAIHSYPTPGTTGMSNGTGNCERANKLHEEGRISDDERKSMRAGNGGQLNPDWVEWLMGWPIGWTKLEPIELDWRDWSIDPSTEENRNIPRVDSNIPNRIKRLKAIGNGQVPQVAALAWRVLNEQATQNKQETNNENL